MILHCKGLITLNADALTKNPSNLCRPSYPRSIITKLKK